MRPHKSQYYTNMIDYSVQYTIGTGNHETTVNQGEQTGGNEEDTLHHTQTGWKQKCHTIRLFIPVVDIQMRENLVGQPAFNPLLEIAEKVQHS